MEIVVWKIDVNVTTNNILSLATVVVVFTALIGGVYGFVIPAFFADYKTYSILIIGVGTAALFGGYIGYQVLTDGTLLSKIGIGIGCATVVAILVTFLSLLIILNVRGS